MQLHPIATFHSPLKEKFGVPKQSGLVATLPGIVVFEKAYAHADYVRGLESFDYLWLLWGFSANGHAAVSPVVRPPRLGGNAKMGVFATRSPYRPNAIGLSSVRLHHVDFTPAGAPMLHVEGADLMDGTPIYDIKPYVAYADSHPNVRSGFVDAHPLKPLKVEWHTQLPAVLTTADSDTIAALLAQDPRPHYHHDPERIYGMTYKNTNIRFRVDDDAQTIVVVEVG